ncbi:hypothetical protein RCH14_003846 [Massilia sp. MP_M2]
MTSVWELEKFYYALKKPFLGQNRINNKEIL